MSFKKKTQEVVDLKTLEGILNRLSHIAINLDTMEVKVVSSGVEDAHTTGVYSTYHDRSFDIRPHKGNTALFEATKKFCAALRREFLKADVNYDPNRCRKCQLSECCWGYDHIQLDDWEVERILQHLGETSRRKFFTRDKLSLLSSRKNSMKMVTENGVDRCIFLRKNEQGQYRCSIYIVRPSVCRAFNAAACDLSGTMKSPV